MICTCRESTLEPSSPSTFPLFYLFPMWRCILHAYQILFLYSLHSTQYFILIQPVQFLFGSLFYFPKSSPVFLTAKPVTMFIIVDSFSLLLEWQLIALHHCLLLCVFLRSQSVTTSAHKTNCVMAFSMITELIVNIQNLVIVIFSLSHQSKILAQLFRYKSNLIFLLIALFLFCYFKTIIVIYSSFWVIAWWLLYSGL